MTSRSRRKASSSVLIVLATMVCLHMCNGQANTTDTSSTDKPTQNATLALVVPPRLSNETDNAVPRSTATQSTPDVSHVVLPITNSTNSTEHTTISPNANTTQEPTTPTTNPTPPSSTAVVLLNRIASSTAQPTTVLPDTCAGDRLQPVQPIHSEYAQVTKCDYNDTIVANFVQAIFYERCIEDVGNAPILPDEIFNPCAGGGSHSNYVYGDLEDEFLYILQNGSLFRGNKDLSEYDVFDTYCLFADEETGRTLALVCYDQVVSVSKAQAYLYAICMLMSVPCLVVTAYFYLAIRQLRNLHGKSLACHCICMALGFLLLSIVQIRGKVGTATGYVIQYALLACFLWLSVMCIDIFTHVWYVIPRRFQMTERQTLYRFIFYAIICQGIPLILVSLSIANNLTGMPSYFLKGVNEATRWTQQFFIPPISIILAICLVLMIGSFFGFRTLDPIISKAFLKKKFDERHHVKVNVEELDVQLYEDTKQTARSTAYLYIIMAMNWVFEIISFYVSSSMSLELFDIMNALQGIVIFIIFVSLPRPKRIIKHWWVDRGEHNTTEMEELHRQTVIEVDAVEPLDDDENDNHTDDASTKKAPLV